MDNKETNSNLPIPSLSNPIGSGCNRNNKIAPINGLDMTRGGMPAHFYPMYNGNVFSMNRSSYARTATTHDTNNGKALPAYKVKQLIFTSNYQCHPAPRVGRNRYVPECGKPIQSSTSYSASSYIDAKKRNAIGKSSMIIPNKIAYGGIDRNTSRHALQKARNGGCVAPAKKGLNKKLN